MSKSDQSSRSLNYKSQGAGAWGASPALIGVWLVCSILAYMFLVYPAYPTTEGPRMFQWLIFACTSKNGFLHGRLVPFVSLGLSWLAWKQCRGIQREPSMWGLIPIVFALLLYVASIRTIQPRLALIALPFLITGLVHYLLGWRVTKKFLFPAFFLWFSIPVPGLETLLTGRLQVLITQLCFRAGLAVGMDLTSDGSNISIAGSSFEIAAGCSGIRSLMALTMIAAVYAYYTQRLLWKKAFLFACAAPLAIIGNFGRIFSILILSSAGLDHFARTTYHDWGGLLIFFPISLSGLYLIDYALNWKDNRKMKVRKITKKKLPAEDPRS